MSSDPSDPGQPTHSGNPAASPEAAPVADPAGTRRLPPDHRSAGAIAVIGGLGVIAVVVSALIWVVAGDLYPPLGSAIAVANAELLEIEQLLDRLSFRPGKVDGVFDQDTAQAIEAYQRAAGLTVDGRPSTALLNELRKVAGASNPQPN